MRSVNIVRIEYPGHRPGWRVRFVRGAGVYIAHFKDADYGESPARSYDAAALKRDQWLARLPKPQRPMPSENTGVLETKRGFLVHVPKLLQGRYGPNRRFKSKDAALRIRKSMVVENQIIYRTNYEK